MVQDNASKKKITLPLRIFLFLIQAAIVVVSVRITLPMLDLLAMGSGDTVPPAIEPASDVEIVDQFDAMYSQKLAEAKSAALSVRKHFWINPDAKLAPKPNQNCYGESTDPASLQWLLDQAYEQFDLQDTLFSTDIQLAPESKVTYYLDESIFAVTWKVVLDDYVYTISEIKISDPSQICRYVTPGKILNTTTWMARDVNAVVAISGDFFKCRPYGINIYEGQIRRVHSGYFVDTCYVDYNGDLHFTYEKELTTEEEVQTYITENNIDWSVCFGPILIDNGVRCEPPYYMLGEVNGRFPRAAFGQRGELHYVLVTANGEGVHRSNPTIHTFAKNLETFGCDKFYALDGGQTGSIAMNGKLMNPLTAQYEKGQRVISDIIYFVTAVPEIKNETTGS